MGRGYNNKNTRKKLFMFVEQQAVELFLTKEKVVVLDSTESRDIILLCLTSINK